MVALTKLLQVVGAVVYVFGVMFYCLGLLTDHWMEFCGIGVKGHAGLWEECAATLPGEIKRQNLTGSMSSKSASRMDRTTRRPTHKNLVCTLPSEGDMGGGDFEKLHFYVPGKLSPL